MRVIVVGLVCYVIFIFSKDFNEFIRSMLKKIWSRTAMVRIIFWMMAFLYITAHFTKYIFFSEYVPPNLSGLAAFGFALKIMFYLLGTFFIGTILRLSLKYKFKTKYQNFETTFILLLAIPLSLWLDIGKLLKLTGNYEGWAIKGTFRIYRESMKIKELAY